MKRPIPQLVRASLLTLALSATMAFAQTAICYNCPREWADWGSQLRAIMARTGVTVPPDNKNSGQSLAQLVAEKASPVADVTYLGVTFGIQAKKEGVVAPYKPAAWKDIPDGLKEGTKFPLKLKFEKAGELTVQVTAEKPGAHDNAEHKH